MFRQRKIRSLAYGSEQNWRRIDGRDVLAVPRAVIVALAGQEFCMPRGIALAEHETDFEMQMRAVLRNALARVRAAAHRADALALLHTLPNRETIGDLAEVSIDGADFQAF